MKVGRLEEIVVDIGYDGQTVLTCQLLQRRQHVGVKLHLREQFEVALDQVGSPARNAETLKRFFQRKLADLPVAAIGLAVMDDVAVFPELIERQRINV